MARKAYEDFNVVALVATDRGVDSFEMGNDYFHNECYLSNEELVDFPDGIYLLPADEGISLLVLDFSRGSDETAQQEIDDKSTLDLLYDYWSTALSNSVLLPSKPRFIVGDYVKRRGSDEILEVQEKTLSGNRSSWNFKCRSTRGHSNKYTEEELLPIEEDSLDVKAWVKEDALNEFQTSALLTFIKIDEILSDIFYSVNNSRTTFIPYQFLPVLKFLDGKSQRILIADEVGLGKTIEAGLIWRELEHRNMASNVLVICPSNLVSKWKLEMENRFDFQLRDLTVSELDLLRNASSRNRNSAQRFVISLEKARNRNFGKYLNDFLEERSGFFDLIILDEAHNIRNSETSGYRTVEALIEDVESAVFLSATPINNQTDDLYNLMRLLRPDAYGERAVFNSTLEFVKMVNTLARVVDGSDRDLHSARVALSEMQGSEIGKAVSMGRDFQLVHQLLHQSDLSTEDEVRLRHAILSLSPLSSEISRLRRREVVEVPVVREVRILTVEWSEKERRIYDEYVRLIKRSSIVLSRRYGYVAQMPLRFASSCLPAFVETSLAKWQPLLNKFGQLEIADPDVVNSVLSFDDQLEEDDRSDEELMEVPSMASLDDSKLNGDEKFMSHLKNFVGFAQSLKGVDTKFNIFKTNVISFLANNDDQLIVFSFFTGTLKYLENRLSDEFEVRLLYGKTSFEARQNIMSDFRHGEFKILLMSEVGSEGLDFEFCAAMVNYDVPWNPMKIEQRIGRLDRYGQKSQKILIFNMSIKGTIDHDIYMRLFERLNIFQDYVGQTEEVLGSIAFTSEDVAEIWNPDLSEEQREANYLQFEKAKINNSESLKRTISSEALVNTDRLLVKGFIADQKRFGNYVGTGELQKFVQGFLAGVGNAGLQQAGRIPGVHRLRIDDSARRYISRYNRDSRQFDRAIKNGEDAILTFESALAVENGYDFVDLAHPLVAGAREFYKRAEKVKLHHGRVRIADNFLKGHFLAKICLAGSNRGDYRKLAAFAVSCLDGRPYPEVGILLMARLADGALENWIDGGTPEYSENMFDNLEDAEMDWRKEEESREQAKLDARREAELSRKRIVIQNKIEQLERSMMNSSNDTYIKGQKTKISNRKAELASILENQMVREWVSIDVIPKMVIDLEIY